MRRVLIIGPNYYNFIPAVERAFSSSGWETDSIAYDNPIHPYTTLMKWRYKLSCNRERMQNKSRSLFCREAKERFDRFRPDLVFVLNGDILQTPVLDGFREAGAKIALWLFDNRERLPRSEDLASHVDKLFCFEQEDAEWFRARGFDSAFLPQACDTSVYYPLGIPKDIDILFVGNLWNSPKRKETMCEVIRAFPGRKIVVYGLYQPWYKGVWRWITRPYKSVFRNRNIPPEKVNELYNRARVVLNIHQELQKQGANPRVFEICGSGAYQVCDYNEYVESLFAPGDIGLYKSFDELKKKISDSLSEDTALRAESARRTVLAANTFESRIRSVLVSLYGKDSLFLPTNE